MKKIKLDIQANSTLQDWESGLDTVDSLHSSLAEDRFTDNSIIRGTLTTPVAPPSKAKALKERFSGFNIATDDNLMQFEDSEVAKVIGHNAGGGEAISKEAWGKVTSIGTWFQGNKNIKTFEELAQSGITTLASGAFENCDNLALTTDMLWNIKTLNSKSLLVDKLPPVVCLANVTGSSSPFGPQGERPIIGVFFAPKAGDIRFRGKSPKLVDYATTSIGQYQVYQSDYSASIFVFRSKTLISVHSTCVSCVKDIGKIFVQPEIYEEQIAVSGFDAGNVHPIGGDQWQTEFGSPDEYADIRKYVTDEAEQERIIQAYLQA